MFNIGLIISQIWLFVTGTSIISFSGVMAVEQIRPGMMVWCAPEDGTGVACYRPILETYQNRADAIYHIRYDHDGDSATPAETLSASAEHPVWVEEYRAFLPAGQLREGMTLRMAGGQASTIEHVNAEQTAPRGGTPVFNFAVAEHHTYYAGTGGVWVHNLCTEGLERFAAKFDVLLKKELENLDGIDNPLAYEEAAKKFRLAIKKDYGLNDKEVEEGMAYTWDRIRNKTQSPKQQWDEIEEVLESRRDNHLRRGNAADDIRSRYYETLGGHREVEVITSNGKGARLDNWITGNERISRKDTDRIEEMLSGIREFDSKYDNALLADTDYARLNYPASIGQRITGNKILEIPPLAPGATLPVNLLQEAANRGIRIRDYAGKYID